ncbi:hypothetical protein JCM8547_000636 [Rhodosporidiobolus lusitaniae]
MLSRACARCHKKKVKCDGALPTCTPCAFSKQGGDGCDVSDCLVYSAAHVASLKTQLTAAQARVQWLEHELDERTDGNAASVETGGFIPKTTVALSGAGTGIPGMDNEVDKLATEVGMLALKAGSGGAPYVGSASGITMARILASAILLEPDDEQQDSFAATPIHTARLTGIHAGLPPLDSARHLLHLYLTRVHVLYPVVNLTTLLSAFEAFYPSQPAPIPLHPSAFCRFLVFAVFAIGASEARSFPPERAQSTPLWTPEEFFSTASSFIPQVAANVGMEPLVMTLLVLLYGLRNPHAEGINLWQWSSHSLTLAVELGLSRSNSAWPFHMQETDYRRRVWWITYSLERNLAVRTGRTLKIRDFAIDAGFPRALNESFPPSQMLPHGFQPSYSAAMHLCRLSQLSGIALETVYAVRSSKRSLAAEDVAKQVWALQASLIEWAQIIPQVAPPDSLEFDFLTAQLYQVSPLCPGAALTASDPDLLAAEAVLSTLSTRAQLTPRYLALFRRVLAGFARAVAPLTPTAMPTLPDLNDLDQFWQDADAVLSTTSWMMDLEPSMDGVWEDLLAQMPGAEM